jgi:hypothetical protein
MRHDAAMRIEVAFDEDDRRRLAHALGPGRDVDELAKLLSRAGAAELLALATGRAVPGTITEARAFRILNLLQQGVDLAEIEPLVAVLFKVPSSTATRMVASALARYSVELQPVLEASVRRCLDAAVWDDDAQRWEVDMPSTFLRERVLRPVERLPLPDATRARGSVWRLPDETYQHARGINGLPARRRDAER